MSEAMKWIDIELELLARKHYPIKQGIREGMDALFDLDVILHEVVS